MGHLNTENYPIKIRGIRNASISLIVISLLLVSAIPAYAGAPIASDSVSTYIVVFNDTPGVMAASSVNGLSSFVASHGGAVKYKYDIINGMAVTISDSEAGQLSKMPNVKYVEKDNEYHILLNDSIPQIGANQVWGWGYNGTGIKVAIIDTGIDASHPDLNGGKVVGWADFVNGNNTAPYDDHGHGTHCAGIVAGTGAASGGLYTGVAPGASLIGVKVLNYQGSGYPSNIINGINWAVNNGANVISMSFGADKHDQSMDDAVTGAVSRGVTVVIAAGNSGSANTIKCPGDTPAAITVGAVDKSDNIATFSSRGPNRDGSVKPDVTNVGVNIVSAMAKDAKIGTPLPGNSYYMPLSGTSMATPMTAGVVALMLQKDPSLTPAQVKEILNRTSKNLGNGVGGVPNNIYGWGRVQAYNAVFNITYNGTVALNKTAFSASEGAGNVTVGVQRYDDGLGSMTIDYNMSGVTAIAGRDYIDSNGTLAFGPGESFKIINVTLLDNNIYEGSRLLNLNLNNPTGNSGIDSYANGTLTITDNDPLPRMQFSLTNYTVAEGGIAYLNVTRANDAVGTYRVHLTTNDSSAQSGTDYISLSTDVLFNQGEMYHLVPVTTRDDGLYWDREKQFYATLSTTGDGATLGANNPAYVNLTETDPVPVIQLNATSFSVSENGGFRAINVTRVNDAINNIAINYSTSDGTARQGANYGNTTGNLTFKKGEMWKVVNIPVYRDDLYTGPLSFTFSLDSKGMIYLGANRTASITITNVDPAPVVDFASPAYNVDDKNGSVNLVVTRLNDATSPVTVQYNTSDGTAKAGVNYTATNGILTFSQGEMNHTIQVPLIASQMAEGANATFIVTLTNPAGGATLGVPNRTIVNIINSTSKFTFDLKQGWNIISMPFVPQYTNITDLIPPDALDDIEVIWKLNGSWSYYTPRTDLYEQGTLTTIDERYGYYVYCDNNTSFQASGTPANESISLINGWNLIGNPTLNERAPWDVYSNFEVMWEYNSSSSDPWSYYTPRTDLYDQGTLTSLKPGFGYWIYYNG